MEMSVSQAPGRVRFSRGMVSCRKWSEDVITDLDKRFTATPTIFCTPTENCRGLNFQHFFNKVFNICK